MTAVMTQQLGMALDDYMQRYADEGRFEIIDGIITFMSPNVSGHTVMVRRVFLKLYQHLADDPNWEVFQESAFAQIIPGQPNWIKGALEPDVMVLSKPAWEAAKSATADWEAWPITVVPLLAIEVVSPTDRYTTIVDKIAEYFRIGVAVVWLIDPRHKTVSIYREGNMQPEVLGRGQVLTAPAILPAFEWSVETLFTQL